MSKKILPWLLLICALGLSSTAAYYSVLGLSIVFSAVALPVIIMGSFLEASKLVIATYLHNQWKQILIGSRIYLTLALIVLSVITSIGVYGLLSKGFSGNIAKLNINQSVIENIEVKKDRFILTKEEKKLEKQTLSQDVSELRKQLSSGTRIEYKDPETGEIISTTSRAARRSFENQLEQSIENRDTISKQVDALNDSITKLELEILDLESDEELNGELGVVKYISEITNKPLETVANWLILTLIFVFDPLAITLVISASAAFKNAKPKKNIYGENKTDTPNPPIFKPIIETETEEEKPSPPSSPTPQNTNNKLEEERSKILKSGYSSKKRKEKLAELDKTENDRNIKTY